MPQQRHRHRRVTGHTYDPCAALKRNFLRACATAAPVPKDWPRDATLRVELQFVFRRPKSHLRKNGTLTTAAPVRHRCRPDVDNLAKFVLDSLQPTYYLDDSQIAELHVEKKYGDDDVTHVALIIIQ